MQSVFNISINKINGEQIDWNDHRGKKLLIVNVASECGFTPQYAQLQELYELFGDKLSIIGCPCNDFGGQEPGSAEEIAEFCDLKYRIRFPLSEKVGIKKNTHPLFQFLCFKSLNGVADVGVKWNFYKFLLDENGALVTYFPTITSPLDQKMLDWLNS
ncbi:MAG TPA: glutathione peroxidase [Saprospiraceae bacterium]|nr:glutathione peroxidase [Saprospiraceae bacterium]